MNRTVEFYRCRACWTMKAVSTERDPMANSLEYIKCPACQRQEGYTRLRYTQTPAGYLWECVGD